MVESPPQYTPRGHGCKYQSCFQNIHWSLPGYTAVTGCFWAREYAEHSPQAVDTCPLLITSEWPLHFLYISRGDLSSPWAIHPECSILLQFPLTLIRKSSPWCSLSIWHSVRALAGLIFTADHYYYYYHHLYSFTAYIYTISPSCLLVADTNTCSVYTFQIPVYHLILHWSYNSLSLY